MRKKCTVIEKEDVVIRFSGDSGDGMQLTGTLFSETAALYGNAIPAVSPADSVRIVTGAGNMPVNRHYLRLIQTPQVFISRLIKKAYTADFNPEFTDDAMVLEKTGEEIRIVEGNRENIKITNPEDMIIAETLLPDIS